MLLMFIFCITVKGRLLLAIVLYDCSCSQTLLLVELPDYVVMMVNPKRVIKSDQSFICSYCLLNISYDRVVQSNCGSSALN